MNVNRIYTHKTLGRIGHVELVAPEGTWTLDGQKLPEQSVEHLLNFALQTLQDAYAGADSADEAAANWEKKRAKLLDGTIGTRGGSGGEEPHVPFIRAIIRKLLGDANRKAYKALGDAKAKNEFLDALFAKQPDAARAKIESAAREELAADLARKAEAAKVANGLGVEL